MVVQFNASVMKMASYITEQRLFVVRNLFL